MIGTAIYGTPFYLTKEERNQLYAANFPGNPGLEVQRDIFIFQCFIGCRVGDMMKMTREEEKHPIWEVASSHMARHILVGNLYKEIKDPNLIAKISGHIENSRAFNRYRNINEEMAKETIMKLE